MSCPKFLAVNKIDVVTAGKADAPAGDAERLPLRPACSPSRRAGATTWTRCCRRCIAAMPEGPKYFPDDMITDQPERVMCAEIIREKALNNLRDEIPHGVGVEMLSD